MLPAHPIAAPNLDGVFDAFVDFLRGGVPYVRERTVREGGEDLQEQAGGGRLKAILLGSRPCLSCTYAVHVNCVPKLHLLIPTLVGFVDFWRSV